MKATPYDYTTIPTKRMAAGAIFFDDRGYILIVKPTYRSGWLLPGGIVEAHESPREACRREIKEELNLDISLDKLLCIEYLSEDGPQTECVQFAFYGGLLNTSQIQEITLPTTELSEYRFSPIEEATTLLSLKLARRVPHCLRALQENITVYLEDGRRVC
jgi:8-oxo-dGTP diphosphatase